MSNTFSFPIHTAFNNSGAPIPGAKLNFYITSTSTRQNTYSDSGLTSVNANPVVADSAGRFGAIFLLDALYKVVLTDADDVEIWTFDPVAPQTRLVGDTSPQLGGKLDTNSFAVDESKHADLASAATVNIGAAAGNYGDITGTTTITAFDTIAAGVERTETFTGALLLTHHATSLILPTGANITTAAGDVAEFTSLGSGNWRCTNYERASGEAWSIPTATDSLVGGAETATQAEMETATAVDKMATPANSQWHPGAAKAWVLVDHTGTAAIIASTSHNITSITDVAVGKLTITLATDMSSVNYILSGVVGQIAADTSGYLGQELEAGSAPAAGSMQLAIKNDSGSYADFERVHVVFFGDQ